jgi:uncharacterized protein (DUF1778 family)
VLETGRIDCGCRVDIYDDMPSEKPRITVYIDEDTKTDLEQLAMLNDRSASSFVKVLIKRAIAEAKKNGEF